MLQIKAFVSVKALLVDRECKVDPTTVFFSAHLVCSSAIKAYTSPMSPSRQRPDVWFSGYPADIIAANTIAVAEKHVHDQAISIGTSKSGASMNTSIGSLADPSHENAPTERPADARNTSTVGTRMNADTIRALGYDDHDVAELSEHMLISTVQRNVDTSVRAVRVGRDAPATAGRDECIGSACAEAQLAVSKDVNLAGAELVVQVYTCLSNHRNEPCFRRCGFGIVRLDALLNSTCTLNLFDNTRWSSIDWHAANVIKSVTHPPGDAKVRRTMRGTCRIALSRLTKDALKTTIEAAEDTSRADSDVTVALTKCSNVVGVRDDVRRMLVSNFTLCNDCINPRILPGFAVNGIVVPPVMFVDVCGNLSSLSSLIQTEYIGPTHEPFPFTPTEAWYLNILDMVLDRRASWMHPQEWHADHKKTMVQTLAEMTDAKKGATETTRATLLMEIATIVPSAFPYAYDYMIAQDPHSSSTQLTLIQADEFVRCLLYVYNGDCEDDVVASIMLTEALCQEVVCGRVQSPVLINIAAARATHALCLALKMVQCASAESSDKNKPEFQPAAHACVDLVPLSNLSMIMHTGEAMVSGMMANGTSHQALQKSCNLARKTYANVANLPRTTPWRSKMLAMAGIKLGEDSALADSSLKGNISRNTLNLDRQLVVVGEGTGIVTMVRPDHGDALDVSVRGYVKETFISVIEACKVGSREEFTHPHESIFYLYTMSALFTDNDLAKMGIGEVYYITSATECGGDGSFARGVDVASQPRCRHEVFYGVPHDLYVAMDGWIGALPFSEDSCAARLPCDTLDPRSINIAMQRDVPMICIDTPLHDSISHDFASAIQNFEAVLSEIDAAARNDTSGSHRTDVRKTVKGDRVGGQSADVDSTQNSRWGHTDVSTAIVCVQLQYLTPSAVCELKNKLAKATAIVDCKHTIQHLASGLAVAVFRVLVVNALIPRETQDI